MKFKKPSGTSRGVLRTKDSWFLELINEEKSIGIGECSTISGLSPDINNQLERRLASLVSSINQQQELNLQADLFKGCPALSFCYEMALLDLKSGAKKQLFQSDFLKGAGIPINGLVWMGEKKYMFDQIKTLISKGYRCIKLKIAAIDFEEELSLLAYIRKSFNASDIEIRVDANGGFSAHDALEKLKRLSAYSLHSIEQPIKPGQIEEMAILAELSPLDIALDEELVGISSKEDMMNLLSGIRPQFIILKPSLLGGFAASESWIELAEKYEIGWWVTSALEANIGLNAIAQWTAILKTNIYQGLGTGQLFTNNISSPLEIQGGFLYHGLGEWGKI